MPPSVAVRAAVSADLPELIELIREHAEYERAAPPPSDLVDGLSRLLFGPVPRLHAFVGTEGDDMVGYATASLEASTWQGAEFLHMDCLFLRPGARGAGLGGRLVDALRDLAGELGVGEMRWQTPDWNEGAIRFYDRTGATRSTKQRYTLFI
ncbi:GNAT family N-acetyltransferase [Leifsonia sp. YIM 134122]|uniref:GNAT family N-acetyltransferase n=1 Tax=Leifsonia stereocauli TaxID=3134136 RepID=A0ABU9W2F0_9MICO